MIKIIAIIVEVLAATYVVELNAKIKSVRTMKKHGTIVIKGIPLFV